MVGFFLVIRRLPEEFCRALNVFLFKAYSRRRRRRKGLKIVLQMLPFLFFHISFGQVRKRLWLALCLHFKISPLNCYITEKLTH